MKIYTNFNEIDYNPNTVLTVGTFDGVHLGHQKIIKNLLLSANELNCRALLITFDPHPQIVLQKSGKQPIKLLTNIPERIRLFEKFGLENVLVAPFTVEFSQTPPEKFVEDFLLSKIGLKKIFVGYDHLFGRNREGNEDLLNDLSKKNNFGVEKIEPEIIGGLIVSSSKIRNFINEGKITESNQMLGHEYIISGKITHGFNRGITLGFPTANINLDDKYKLVPKNGVYIVSSTIDDKKYYGLANVGFRPTFETKEILKLEVFYFDFSGDLYDKVLTVEFLDYIRPELKFNNVDELIEQMKQDEIKARQLIKVFK